MIRAITILLFFSFFLSDAAAQLNPVSWSYKAEKINDTEYNLILTASVDPGWFIYSQYLESDDGPIRTSFQFNTNDNIELIEKTTEEGNRKEGYDNLFDMNVIKFSGTTQFTQRIKLAGEVKEISGNLEFMTCDDDKCLPPQVIDFTISLP